MKCRITFIIVGVSVWSILLGGGAYWVGRLIGAQPGSELRREVSNFLSGVYFALDEGKTPIAQKAVSDALGVLRMRDYGAPDAISSITKEMNDSVNETK